MTEFDIVSTHNALYNVHDTLSIHISM